MVCPPLIGMCVGKMNEYNSDQKIACISYYITTETFCQIPLLLTLLSDFSAAD